MSAGSGPSGTPSGEPASRRPQVPGWSFLGCGCAALVLVAMLGIVGVSVLSWRQAKQFRAGLGDPAVAAAQVAEVLPHRSLPEGYYPLGGLSVPLLFDLAALTDLPPEERSAAEDAARFHRAGFLYVSRLSPRGADAQLTRGFEEGSGGEMELTLPDDDIGRDLAVGFDSREVLGRGAVAIPGGEALWVARLGTVSLRDDSFEGLATLLYLRCGDDRRIRLGMWFAPLPGGAAAPEASTWPGTPADPRAVERFLGHFEVCG